MDRIDEIRKLAYYQWETAGRPEGLDLDFWLAAEDVYYFKQKLFRPMSFPFDLLPTLDLIDDDQGDKDGADDQAS